MIEDGCIEAIISLPRNLFHRTDVAVTIWLLRRPCRPTDILFVDASDAGHMVSRTQRVMSDEELEEISATVTAWRAGQDVSSYSDARSVPLAEVLSYDHSLNPAAYLIKKKSEFDVEQNRQALSAAIYVRQEAAHVTEESENNINKIIKNLGTLPLSDNSLWRHVALSEICGITPGAPTSDEPEGNTRVAKPRNLVSGRLAGPTDWTNATESQRSKYSIRGHDILCTRTGTMGKIALVLPEQEGWLFGTGLLRLRPLEGVDPTFLSAYLTRPDVVEWITRNSKGTAIQSITAKTMGTLRLHLPPLSVQKRIGAAIKTLDENIITHTRIQQETARVREYLLTALTSSTLTDNEGPAPDSVRAAGSEGMG
jgi:type I restriction enzyme M protein